MLVASTATSVRFALELTQTKLDPALETSLVNEKTAQAFYGRLYELVTDTLSGSGSGESGFALSCATLRRLGASSPRLLTAAADFPDVARTLRMLREKQAGSGAIDDAMDTERTEDAERAEFLELAVAIRVLPFLEQSFTFFRLVSFPFADAC